MGEKTQTSREIRKSFVSPIVKSRGGTSRAEAMGSHKIIQDPGSNLWFRHPYRAAYIFKVTSWSKIATGAPAITYKFQAERRRKGKKAKGIYTNSPVPLNISR